MKRIIALTLALLMLFTCLVSCKKEEEADPQVTVSTADTVGFEISEKLNGVNLEGEEINIWQFTQASNSAEFFYDQNGSLGEGDLISEQIYQRNAVVEDLLKCKIVFTDTGEASTKSGEFIRILITAGDTTYQAFDIIQWNGMPLALEGLFTDLTEAPYIDYSKPWWNEVYMEATEVQNKRFVLAGDVSIDMISCASAMFVNKAMLAEYHGDGAYESICELVRTGKWTWEEMKKLCTGVYVDLDNNNEVDINDRFAFLSNYSNRIDSWFFGFGGTVFKKEDTGLYSLNYDNEMNLNRMEVISDIMWRLGISEYGNWAGSTQITGELTEAVVKKFALGQTMFHGGFLYTARNLSNMKNSFGVVPYPKYNEDQQSYNSVMHNIVTMFAIPNNCTKLDSTCAVFEALSAAGHEYVVPTYYETVLKIRYADDVVDAEMIDIIYDTRMTDSGYIFENEACECPRFMIMYKMNFTFYPEKYGGKMEEELRKVNEALNPAE